jgi:hypothetical protein
MINWVSFLLINVVSSQSDGTTWCQWMHKDYVQSAEGGFVENTRWQFIERYPSGRGKIVTDLNEFGFTKATWKENGQLESSIRTQPLATIDHKTLITTVTYNESGLRLRDEDRNLSGTLVSWRENHYDSQNRFVLTSSAFGVDDPYFASSELKINYEQNGETQVYEAVRHDAGVNTVFVRNISKYDLNKRMLSFEEYSNANMTNPSMNISRLTTYEYDVNEYSRKEISIDYTKKPVQKTISLYDDRNRLVSISYLDGEGNHLSYRRIEYNETLDDSSQITHSENLSYISSNDGEVLKEKTVTDFQYGPQGIESRIEWTYDPDGRPVKGAKDFYTYQYCN